MWFLCCALITCVLWFFFFKQKTAYEMRISDWSSDVCSSDLRRQSGTRRAASRDGRRHRAPPRIGRDSDGRSVHRLLGISQPVARRHAANAVGGLVALAAV